MSTDLDPFWVKHRAEYLARKSTTADPSACGTCRSNVAAGEPVKHDECAQRATLLQAPDQPNYEILAGFSLAENEQLPARFHVPVFDDCGIPNSWLCAVCWEEGVITAWPCATATKYGTKVFSPLHEAETAQKRTDVELDNYRALELGDPDGRVSASCGDPEHPTWLRAQDDTRGCPWCQVAELEAELARERENYAAYKSGAEAAKQMAANRINAVLDICDREQRNAMRWEDPIPVPDWVPPVQRAALGDDKRQIDAAQHFDKVPDPLDGCHWCACGNRWPCKDAAGVAA